MDEQPNSVKVNKGPTPPHKAQAESRPSYLDTVLSYPPQPTAPSLPPYDPYTTYRPAAYRSTALSTAMGLNNTTNDTLVMPPLSTTTPMPTNIPNFHDYPSGAFCIDCNNCGKSIPHEHYHCSICDAGDFDLCQGCVDRGVTCDGEEHWLIKRSIRGGMVIPSVTETIAPKKPISKPVGTQDMKESVPLNEYEDESVAERTCNSCIRGDLPHA
jgi:next-to-BRCA1 protein 1